MLNLPNYNLIGGVKITPVDISGIRQANANVDYTQNENKVKLGQINDQAMARKIITKNTKADGSIDYDRSIAELTTNGLTDYAKQTSELKNKYEDQLTETASREGYKKYQEDVKNGIMEGEDIPEQKFQYNRNDLKDPSIDDQESKTPGSNLVYDEITNTFTRTTPGQQKSKRELTYDEKTNSFIKNVIPNTDTGRIKALELEKTKDQNTKLSEQDKKEIKLQKGWDNIMMVSDPNDPNKKIPNSIYQSALDAQSNNASKDIIQQKVSNLLSYISKSNAPENEKSIWKAQIIKDIPIPDRTLLEELEIRAAGVDAGVNADFMKKKTAQKIEWENKLLDLKTNINSATALLDNPTSANFLAAARTISRLSSNEVLSDREMVMLKQSVAPGILNNITSYLSENILGEPTTNMVKNLKLVAETIGKIKQKSYEDMINKKPSTTLDNPSEEKDIKPKRVWNPKTGKVE